MKNKRFFITESDYQTMLNPDSTFEQHCEIHKEMLQRAGVKTNIYDYAQFLHKNEEKIN